VYDAADQNYLIFGKESCPSTAGIEGEAQTGRYRCVVHYKEKKGPGAVKRQFGKVTVVARGFSTQWVKEAPLPYTEYGKTKRISTDHLADLQAAAIYKRKWQRGNVAAVAGIALEHGIGVKQVHSIWSRDIRTPATQYV
jgi:hypothetical protein